MRQTAMLSIALVFAMLGMSAPNKKDAEPQRIPVKEIGSKYVVIGELGVPVGEVVEIHGKLRRDLKDGDFLVLNEMNGKPLERTISIKIRGTKDWADGTIATVRGHERAEIDFLRQLRSSPSKSPPFTPFQIAFNNFVPTEVLEPAELKINMNQN